MTVGGGMGKRRQKEDLVVNLGLYRAVYIICFVVGGGTGA
jgi:hypothetical protein